MSIANSDTFDVAGKFSNLTDLNEAVNGVRLMFDYKPKFDGPYMSNIKRRRIGPIVLAEMESDPCTGQRNLKNIKNDDNFICVTSQIHGSLKQEQNNLAIEVDAGDLYIWDGHDPISIDVKDRIKVKTVWIDRSFFKLRSSQDTDYFFTIIPKDNPIRNIVYKSIIDLHELADKMTINQTMMMASSFVEAFSCCISFLRTNYTKTNCEIYDKSIEYINENISDMYLSIEELSQYLSLGERSIQRAFAINGTTYGSYVRQARLKEAARLLSLPTAQKISLTDLAHQLAFYDLAHFSRIFKQSFGRSPNDFRKGFLQ